MSGAYIMALDQGTTSSRCVIFDRQGGVKAAARREFTQIYPRPGLVEHNPMEIWGAQAGAAAEALAIAGLTARDIASMGITNQRETVVLWDRTTSVPIMNAIVWQCRRTADECRELEAKGLAPMIREKTGLVTDAYFSATKIKWVLDNIAGARSMAEAGRLLFGTVDTWLIWNLTKGKSHVTDRTNASRTMLYNIHTLDWDTGLLELFGIPRCMLPEVLPSCGLFGYADPSVLGGEIPITGVAGDQQSALFGQMCVEPGAGKNTYGTGCFLLMNTGSKAFESKNGLLTTLAATHGESVQYALEGSIFVGGSVVQWLRDELGLIKTADEAETHARRVPDTNGVYFVPAFVGLGAPYWNSYARGAVFGLTRGTKKEHIIRAALESMAYQTLDVINAMEADAGMPLKYLRADGGASSNNFLMQFQSDILNKPLTRPKLYEATALGAAYLAGLGSAYWQNLNEIKNLAQPTETFTPSMPQDLRGTLVTSWHNAVDATIKEAENREFCHNRG